MANTFKNAGLTLTNVSQNIYTCPVATQAVVHNLQFANTDGSNTAEVSVTITNSGGTFQLGKQISIPGKSAVMWDKPINLEAGDTLDILRDTAVTCDAFISILEIS